MRARLVLWLYSQLMRALTPLMLFKLWWRGRQEPLYRQQWWTRWGIYPGWSKPDALAPRAWTGRLIWLHAVSLGETRAAQPLIAALRAQLPGMRLLLTHGTATGYAAGQALLQAGDVQVWVPLDTPGAVRRFLRRFQPELGVLMETEVWPVMLDVAQKQGLAMVLANARLSERSRAKALRVQALSVAAFSSLRLVLAQTLDDARRLKAMGCGRIELGANLKYDMTPDAGLLQQGRALRQSLRDTQGRPRPVVVLASSREGEEKAFLALWSAWSLSFQQQALAHLWGRPLLVVVPRHPQRFEEVAALVQQQGLQLSRRSEALKTESWRSCEVLLGDSMGEMPLYFALGHVALLGGSFQPCGGQNLIEAAACGCPLIMGPSVFNFAQAAQESCKAGAALQSADAGAALSAALDLLLHRTALQAMQQATLRFAHAHQGAAQQQAKAIVALLDHKLSATGR